MLLTDIGNELLDYSLATADYTFTPLTGRDAFVTKLSLINVSADDIWDISVSNKPIISAPIFKEGAQRFFGDSDELVPQSKNIFDYYKKMFNQDYILPVPGSINLEIKSRAGATADIILEGQERSLGDASVNMLNHFNGNHYCIPVFGAVAASITAAGEHDIDTYYAPQWVPNVFVPSPQPSSWRTQLLALFVSGGSVNTFNGAADHISRTEYLAVRRQSMRQFVRNNKGIPTIGKSAAAGSANKVYTEEYSPFPSFQLLTTFEDSLLKPPMAFMPGLISEFSYGYTGSFTGGADYSKVLIAGLLDIVFAPGQV